MAEYVETIQQKIEKDEVEGKNEGWEVGHQGKEVIESGDETQAENVESVMDSAAPAVVAAADSQCLVFVLWEAWATRNV